MSTATLPALIQRFFTDRLCVQMEASHHTVASYRDTFRLLIQYARVETELVKLVLDVLPGISRHKIDYVLRQYGAVQVGRRSHALGHAVAALITLSDVCR